MPQTRNSVARLFVCRGEDVQERGIERRERPKRNRKGDQIVRSFPQPELSNSIPDWIPYIASPGSITVLSGERQFIVCQVPEDAIAIIANLIDFWNITGETKRKLSADRHSPNPNEIPHVRWQDIVSQLASADYRAVTLRRELQQIQSLCGHQKLPKRNPGEEYQDQCPDCGYISYCVRA